MSLWMRVLAERSKRDLVMARNQCTIGLRVEVNESADMKFPDLSPTRKTVSQKRWTQTA